MSQSLSPNLVNAIAGNYQLEIKAVLLEAWKKVKGMKASLWGAIIVSLLISMGIGFVAGLIDIPLQVYGLLGATQVIQGVVNIIGGLLGALFLAGELFMGFNRAVDRPVRVLQLFAFRGSSFKVIVASLLFFVFGMAAILLSMGLAMLGGFSPDAPKLNFALVGGFLLAVFLFAYITLIYYMLLLLILEKKLGVWIALKCAVMGVTQHFIKNVAINLSMLLIFIVGTAITLSIGMIWIIPMAFNVIGIQYRQIFGVDSVGQS